MSSIPCIDTPLRPQVEAAGLELPCADGATQNRAGGIPPAAGNYFKYGKAALSNNQSRPRVTSYENYENAGIRRLRHIELVVLCFRGVSSEFVNQFAGRRRNRYFAVQNLPARDVFSVHRVVTALIGLYD